MATATPTKPPLRAIGDATNPLALWHLLSLDAPTVAVVWTWFIAAANHIRLPLASTLAMTITVWMLYAADRLMDARLMDARLMDVHLTRSQLSANHADLEARHYFHHRHRSAFLAGILLGSIALATLLPRLEAEAIYLYLILGGLVSGYFILIHATRSAHRLPKEIAVGLCFAAATFIPTVARRPDLRLSLLPTALLFAALCSLNCLFIYQWEHEVSRTSRPTHAITHLALRNLRPLTILLTLVSIALALFDQHTPQTIPCATAISAALLLLLHYRRRAISPTTLRAAADLALATPLLLLPFLHQ
ncbi:MAG: hypothetical protein ABSA39_15920 [Edaphobacter sp.]